MLFNVISDSYTLKSFIHDDLPFLGMVQGRFHRVARANGSTRKTRYLFSLYLSLMKIILKNKFVSILAQMSIGKRCCAIGTLQHGQKLRHARITLNCSLHYQAGFAQAQYVFGVKLACLRMWRRVFSLQNRIWATCLCISTTLRLRIR